MYFIVLNARQFKIFSVLDRAVHVSGRSAAVTMTAHVSKPVCSNQYSVHIFCRLKMNYLGRGLSSVALGLPGKNKVPSSIPGTGKKREKGLKFCTFMEFRPDLRQMARTHELSQWKA